MSGTEAGEPSFARSTALAVEDEALVAFDLEDLLYDLGFGDVVLCNSYEAAERALDARRFRVAVFDLNLAGRISTPLIDRALAAGTHVIVASGYEVETVPLHDASIPRITKPYDPMQLESALLRLTRSA